MAFLGLTLCLINGVFGAIPVTKDMKTFGYAIKAGHLNAYEEQVVYYTDEGPGVVTEQAFVAGYNEDTIVRYYIDGEKKPTIEARVLLMHGIGSSWDEAGKNTPWGNKRIGHNANNGGLWNTIRIPFKKSLNVTILNTFSATFWYIIRGVYDYQIIVGDLLLPKDTKLKLYRNENIEVPPLNFITLANISNSSGLIYLSTFLGESSDYNFLEACIRANIDGSNDTIFLSSGTEDYFLSAYYFDVGVYEDSQAGCTMKDGPGSMSAYKFFELDPILFTDSIELRWRNWETSDGDGGCPRQFPYNPNSKDEMITKNGLNASSVEVAGVLISTYTWVYEYKL